MNLLARSLLLLGVFGLIVINAQTCDYYNNDVANCDSWVSNGTLYIPPTLTKDDLIANGNTAANGALFAAEPCRTLLAQFSCGGIFRPCIELELSAEGNYTVVYQPVCKWLCRTMVGNCSSIIEANGRPVPDCDQIDPLTGQDLYPEYGLNFTLYNGTDVFIECNDVDKKESNSTTSCPYPTTLVDGGCAVRCPDPMYTETEYTIAEVITYTPAWISFMMINVSFFTFVIDKNRRRWPHSIPYWCALSIQGLMLAFVISSVANGGKDIWCENEGKMATQHSSSTCAFQGFLVVYTVYAISLWMIAFDLVVLYKLITLRDLAYQKAFQIFCWGSPLIPAIVVAAWDKIGYSSGGLFCLMVLEIGEDDPSYYLSTIVMYPTVTLFGISILGIFAIVYFINEIRKKSMSERVKELNLKVELSMLAFLILMVVLTLPSYIRFFISLDQRPKIQDAYKEWIQCALSGEADCSLSTRPSYPLMIIYGFTAGVCGIACVLVLGMHQDTIRYWKPRIIYWVTGVSPEAQTSATLPTISLEDLESRSRFSINLNEEEDRS